MSLGERTNRPLLLGHRGARAIKSIPENTLASFDRALGDGCDGFEFDVRLTADGAAVVCHDPRWRGIEIVQASADRLRALPSLEQVLARYAGKAFLDIELKVTGLEKITAGLLRRSASAGSFVVSSFLPDALWAVHAEAPAIPLGLISEKRSELELWSQLPIEYVFPHRKLVDRALVGAVQRVGKKVMVWTVNTSAEMRRFAALGVDGIISDRTSLLCRSLSFEP